MDPCELFADFRLGLVPAGRLGDVVGRRRLFLAGLSIFAVMGILGACASDPSMIVLARLGQGDRAGTISSQVLGIITDRVSGKARAKALARTAPRVVWPAFPDRSSVAFC